MQQKSNPSGSAVATILELMEQVSLLSDRSNFLRQRCSGLGRMECQTLQLLDGYRRAKGRIQDRIRKRKLRAEEIPVYLPRGLRKSYEDGELSEEVLVDLPRDLSMKALADEIGVACSRMTRIGDTLSDEVDGLTKKVRGKGLIHREPSPDDRRVILIRITEKGQAKVAEQGRQTERIAGLLLERIPEAKRAIVEEGLRVYLKALGEILPRMAEDGAEDLADDCTTNN